METNSHERLGTRILFVPGFVLRASSDIRVDSCPFVVRNIALSFTNMKTLMAERGCAVVTFLVSVCSAVSAQTYTTLHSFATGTGFFPYSTNSDGARVLAGLVVSDENVYGVAQQGGRFGLGTVFKVRKDGSGFTNLHIFSGSSDQGLPSGKLVLAGDTLYGTTLGTASGTVFALKTDGTAFQNVHVFNGVDGANPGSSLVVSGNTLYGTTDSGAESGHGTVFAVQLDGTGFRNLHRFTTADGEYVHAGLALVGTNLYGTAELGGSSDNGTVFAISVDGSSFTNLHNFGPTISNTNSDGAHPRGTLISSGTALYGTTIRGGDSGQGVIFAVNLDGMQFKILHAFTGLDGDGANPFAGLALSRERLYGATVGGGLHGRGMLFSVNVDGTSFSHLHSFTPYSGNKNPDGAGPNDAPAVAGTILYGTASYGGDGGSGTGFSLLLSPPELTIAPSVTSVVVAWPFGATGFTLQSTTNLLSTASWTPASVAPVVVNGQQTVTHPVDGPHRFYRLSH